MIDEDHDMKPSRMAGLVLLALTTACSRAAEPFIIPDLKDVEYASASQLKGTSKVWEHEIRDPRRIAPILAQLRENNSGSGYRTQTRLGQMFSESREQSHAIAFVGKDGVPLMIWIGPDWLGGYDTVMEENGGTISRDRPLGASEREALLALIREPDPMGRVRISNGQYH
jgi:hypothetical protein